MQELPNLDGLLERAVGQHPDLDALVFPDTRHSYQSLWDKSWERARELRGLGFAAGDHLGILMPNCPEYIEFLLAAVLCGGVAVPLNARNKASELAYVIENADLVGLVTSDEISEYVDFGVLLQAALPGLTDAADPGSLALASAPKLRFAALLGESTVGFLSAADLAAGADDQGDDQITADRNARDADAPCIMMYTSGTTANPKGCPLSHHILVRNGVNMNRSRYLLSQEDRFWTPLPMFHMSSILPMVCCFDAGAATLSMRRFDAQSALQMLEGERATVAFPAFPTVMNDLLHHPDFAQTDLQAVRRLNNVAPPDTLRSFQEAMPQAVQTGAYGLTEVGGVIAFNHPEESLERRLHTCGVPFDGIEIRVVEPQTLAELATDERGELQVRGYAVFAGYYRAPEKNAEAFVDGWFRTGDLCSIDQHGGIAFHGRIKDMLKVGGENVAALEIESHLGLHPLIKLAQVVGVPDVRMSEVPVAFIEPVPGARLSSEEVLAHCRGAIASFKVPRYVRFVDAWPMSSTKVQKYVLKNWFETGQSAPDE